MRHSKGGSISNDAPAYLYKKIVLNPFTIAANADQTTKEYENTI